MSKSQRSIIVFATATMLAACAAEAPNDRRTATGASLMRLEAVPPDASASQWRQAGRKALLARLALRANRQRARNIILFIGDGMGVSTVTAARIRTGQAQGHPGEETVLSFERLPHTALVKTYNTDAQVSDSAGTASAIMTGAKTRIGVINTAPEHPSGHCGEPGAGALTTISERAEASGRAVGVVTTTRLTHATPATVYAHAASRDWEDDTALTDEAREAGCADIASQLLQFPGDGLEVAMGGGRRHFLPTDEPDPEYPDLSGRRGDGRNLTREWLQRHANAAYVTTAEQLATIELAEVDHLLGLFQPSHMQFETDRSADAGGEPSLAEMTTTAIDMLGRDPDGFLLMVEGGRIDHAHHGGNAYRALEDTRAFADAVTAALERVDLNETLVLVTADHSHVFTIAGYPARGNDILGLVHPPGAHGTAQPEPTTAADGKPYTTLGYWNGPGAAPGERPRPTGTAAPDYRQQAAVPLRSETHGGEDVALYAAGPWAHLAGGVLEQNVIYHIMAYAAGLDSGSGAEATDSR